MINNNEDTQVSHHRRSTPRFFALRNCLNIIFMLGAVAGVAIYFYSDTFTGTIVILVAMAFKIVECIFRFIK